MNIKRPVSETGLLFIWRSEMSDTQPILSPCTGVCVLDTGGDFCVGCLRTREQIARWTLMEEDERQRVMLELDERNA